MSARRLEVRRDGAGGSAGRSASSFPAPPEPPGGARLRALRWGGLAALLLSLGGLAMLQRRGVKAAPGELATPELRELIHQHTQAVAADPSAANHGALGLVYAANELWSQAEPCFARARELDPREALWALYAGVVAEEQGRPEEALARFEETVALQDDLAAAHARLADAFARAGRPAEALPHHAEAARLAPASVEAHTALGAAQLEAGAHDAARASLEKALALEPAYKSAHYHLGRAYRALGQNEDAARELALGLDAKPRPVPDPLSARMQGLRVGYSTRLDGAVTLLRGGRAAEGIAVLEKLLAERPEDTNVLNNLAAAYLDSGVSDRALPLLERARSISDSEFATWINLSSWASRKGKPEEALRHAERAIELAGEIGAAHLAHGKALLALKRPAEARAALARSAELDARDPDVHALLGVACMELRLPAEAEEHLRTAIRLGPDELEPRILLARLLAGLERYDEARAVLAETRRFAPGHPAVAELERRIDSFTGKAEAGSQPAPPR